MNKFLLFKVKSNTWNYIFVRLVIIQDYSIAKELSTDDRFMGRMSDGLYPGEIRGFNNKATGVAMSEGPIWKHLRKFTLKTLKVL